MRQPNNHFYEFGPFRLDLGERILLRDDEPVALNPKTFDTLLTLVENAGHIVDKDELMRQVWPDTFVDEGTLTRNISRLRSVLETNAAAHEYIETVPRRGYRFVADVRERWEESAAPVVAPVVAKSYYGQSSVVLGEAAVAQKPEPPRDEAKDLPVPPAVVRWRPSRAVWAVSVMLIGAALALTWFLANRPSQPAVTHAAVKSIAVLPFKPLRSDDGDEYLGLGLADSLITKLGGLRQLIVRPTSAVRKYFGPEQDPLAAGREQRVDAVLDSSLQREGERLRVTVRLLQVADGAALWTYQCDEQYCASLFAMQDAISEKVAEALALQLTGEERQRLRKHYTENKEAYQLYLKGRYYWGSRRSIEGIRKAIEYYEQAIRLDQNYALAYAALAQAYNLGFSTTPPKERLPKAKAAALKAVALDETLAEAHAALGMVKMRNDWDWAGSDREYRRAIDLNPNSGDAHRFYATLLLNTGRFDEAIAESRRGEEVEPPALGYTSNLGFILLHTRHYDEAIAEYRKTLERTPNNPFAHNRFGLACARRGIFEQAIAELNQAITLSHGDPLDVAVLGGIYAMSGRRDEARRSLEQLEELSRRTYVEAYYRAIIYAELGEKEQAFAWLEKAYAEHGDTLVYIRMDEAFDSLRADPRFADLLRRMNHAP